MSRQFNIISFNIQGFSSHKHVEIKHLLDNNPQIDILCLQETKFIENYVRTIPGFRSEFKFFSGPNTPKNNIAGGLAIYIKNSINYEVITVDNPTNDQGEVIFEVQAIKIHTNGPPFTLVNLYSRGADQLSLSKIIAPLTQDNNLQECVITGDFNAHHQLWGSSYTNKRGRDIWKWLENNGLVLMNDGTPTRLDKWRGIYSCIDLTLATPKLSASLAWGILDDNMGSDHFPQFITINSKIPEKESSNEQIKFNYEKADWSTFHNLTKQIKYEDVYSDNIDSFLNKLNKEILDRAELSIPA